jgi:1-acyl-sn-glycerol-3-phosphate acyltransferase
MMTAAKVRVNFGESTPRAWEKTDRQSAIVPWVYHAGRYFFKFAFWTSLRVNLIREAGSSPAGGYVLACTHLSHTEPLCASVLTYRRIDWMARIEFYRWKVFAWLLKSVGAFSVNRQGVPVTAIRTSIERLRNGRIVGMFPEGGCVRGKDAVIRGGAVKRGACMVACRARVPIVPCVILGAEKLNRPWPWLPVKRGKLWVAFGRPIPPRPYPTGREHARTRREERTIMAEQMRVEFIRLYGRLREQFEIDDGRVP